MAGGTAKRIGGDKASIAFRGKPLISYPLAAFAEAGIEAVVIAKHGSRLPAVDVPVLLEPDEPRHPLLGIVTALEHAEGRAVVACACDMPFVTAALLSHLAERREPLVVPRAAGRFHPLIARYERSLLDALREALDPPLALHEVIGELDPAILAERDIRRLGDPERLLFNVNTREDLARADEIARG
jgi:molybdenum cofactor guanylyltransferase